MDLKYEIAPEKQVIASMKSFMQTDPTRFLSILQNFYPDIFNDAKLNSFEENISLLYKSKLRELKEKVELYQKWWDHNKHTIEYEFEKIFERSLNNKFNNMVSYVSINPVMPRYLKEQSFDTFYLNSEKGALGSALHEISHFIWFDIWNQTFNDNPSDYEVPHFKWVFSELVVDPLLYETPLQKLNPYPKPSYDGFYDIYINNKSLIDIMRKMKKELSIVEFMKEGYSFCLKHKELIEDIR